LKTEQTREMIRKFIIEKQGKATKNDVVKYMEKDSSRVPTLDMIKELEDTGIINVDKGNKRRGQAHYLVINNENEFNRINQEISEIDLIIDTMEQPMDDIIRLIRKRPELRQDLREDIIFAYKRSIERMLEFLLVYTSDVISSEKSSQILYSKIIKSMQKLEHQYFYSESLDSLNRNIDGIRSILSITNRVKYSRWTKNKTFHNRHLRTKAFNNLIEKIEKFKEQFKPKST
jgi:predicted transcriptional regulator